MQLSLDTLRQLSSTIHALLRRHWQRALQIREKFRFSEEAFHLVLAGGVGVIGGFVNLVFHYGIDISQQLFLHRSGDIVAVAEKVPPLERLVISTVGALLAGVVLYWGLRLVGKQGSSNILEVVVASDGRLPFRTTIVKAISSLLSIGSGASIGREGAITNLAATFASKWGQLCRWQPYRLRLLVACGAASGISAAYNAPIAGAVFAALIVLGNFSMNLFAPLVFSSVVASMVSRSFFGLKPWYEVTQFDFKSLTQLPWFLLLGIVTGVMGAVFLKMLAWSEEIFKRVPAPVYVRLALGGFFAGCLAMAFPQVWGNGYGITNRILHEQFLNESSPLIFLIGLFLAKLLATLATVGSGAVGGVFTPTLFLGAGLGYIFGAGLHDAGQGMVLPTSVFTLVGMGSMLAATTRSPLLAMIMVFEVSLNYSLMPPLMLACVVSTLMARRLYPDSIYTEPLRKKGLLVNRENLRSGSATEQTVGDLMRAPVPPLRETATLQEIADRFLTSSNNFLPVVDSKYQLIGIVALQDLKEYLNAGAEMGAVIAYDVMRPAPSCVTPDQLLLDTLPIMLSSEQRNVPVVNSLSENRLVGAIVRAEVLGLLSEAIAARGQSKGPSELT
ncbi:ClcB-like voltage-gated chloride channel protein [Pedosphaera parvula]|uniref:Chloride channel core n=1 Tax=Pedosphaera parvula (strain Ellin514) TaxID=320771 RepID=B9XDX3_PEDPL|nr:ClcB-like voltage-gated chloride channel protein [Pedosphaera parvula]EEF61864.1 Chloride channel core [Pedosphaera parvula Ellin514]